MTLPPATSWDDWSTVTADVSLRAGASTVESTVRQWRQLQRQRGHAVGVPGRDGRAGRARHELPGRVHARVRRPRIDSGYTAARQARQRPASAQPRFRRSASRHALDRAGYRLLDDSESAVWTHDGWVAAALVAGGDVEDGYLFGYGNDYTQALEDLNKLTGPSPLIDESNFVVWYSDYYPNTTSDYENTLIPDFHANNVPLDDLSVDTDWKSPNQWDGWEWDPARFPDPEAFLSWAKSQGIDVTLNVHASIADNDPQLAATQALANGSIHRPAPATAARARYGTGARSAGAESYFALHQPC